LADPNSEERGFYHFRKGKWVDGKLLPPNNWKGFFATSAWERVGETDDFYLHIFSKKMPDVNWANPALRQRYYEIARHYLDLGVDGFRLDALAHLAKDMTFSDSTVPTDEFGRAYDPSKFSSRPELFDYLAEFKREVLDHYDCLTIGEVGGGVRPEEALRYVCFENGAINMLFNFDTAWCNGAYGSIDKRDDEIKTDIIGMKRSFESWYKSCAGKADLPNYWENHDHPRVLSQYGSTAYRGESAKALATLLLFMYGTPFIYYGDEIGMSNVTYSRIEDFYMDVGNRNDVEEKRALGYSDEQILHYLCRCSRVNARTPMQWNSSPYAGFSNVAPRVKVNDNYLEGVNALDEMNDPYSIINFVQYAIGKRKDPEIAALLKKPWKIVDMNHPDVFAYQHEGEDERLVVVANLRPYSTFFGFYHTIRDVVLHNYGDVIINDHVFTLRPFECFLLRV
jgi:glycosidase